jgi:hypothetical protein
MWDLCGKTIWKDLCGNSRPGCSRHDDFGRGSALFLSLRERFHSLFPNR